MSDAPRTVSGKWMILGVLGVGFVMAVAAWYYYYQQQRRPLQFWGPATARVVMQAPRVEAWRLVDANLPANDEESVEMITVGSSRWRIAARKDVAAARGLVHLRYGFVNDACFDWQAPSPAAPPEWKYALRFADGAATATLLIAPDAQRIRLLETGAEASHAPVAQAYADFFAEQFPREGNEMTDDGNAEARSEERRGEERK